MPLFLSIYRATTVMILYGIQWVNTMVDKYDFRDDPLRTDRLQAPEGNLEEVKNLVDKYANDHGDLSREETLEVFSAVLSMMSIDMVKGNEKLSFEIVENLLRSTANDSENLEKLAGISGKIIKNGGGEELFRKSMSLENNNPVRQYHIQALLWIAAIKNEEGITQQDIHDHLILLSDSFRNFREKRGLE
ncbi:hypothetical protein [Halalkalicoccus sp. NIPERK01]|uniref:hypothetical protein n=1 Tax=Halalkalicoccus sp. NIPERK01 TaxID=3053469 RepID=UPI00256ED150|nr:hypothetical protein [Halalkalicoccus sp. NIPERK01]MDL5362376.1 hypothetical protein [Halalkalicoccus sp. NIPERK01]